MDSPIRRGGVRVILPNGKAEDWPSYRSIDFRRYTKAGPHRIRIDFNNQEHQNLAYRPQEIVRLADYPFRDLIERLYDKSLLPKVGGGGYEEHGLIVVAFKTGRSDYFYVTSHYNSVINNKDVFGPLDKILSLRATHDVTKIFFIHTHPPDTPDYPVSMSLSWGDLNFTYLLQGQVRRKYGIDVIIETVAVPIQARAWGMMFRFTLRPGDR